jgi:hypothetical protein
MKDIYNINFSDYLFSTKFKFGRGGMGRGKRKSL